METNQILRRVPLFSELDDDNLAALAAHAKTRRYNKNTIVLHVGEESTSLYIVASGRVKVYLDDERGREVTLRIMGSGSCFGELALLGGGPRVANVATLDNAEMLTISKADFMHFLRDNSAISIQIIHSLVQRIRDMTEDVSTLALLDVYGRVAKVLTRNSSECNGERLTTPMTHQDIANFVGSSREMVTRVLNDLKQGGYISVRKKQVILEKSLPSGW